MSQANEKVILLVEDDELSAVSLRLYMEKHGFRVEHEPVRHDRPVGPLVLVVFADGDKALGVQGAHDLCDRWCMHFHEERAFLQY